MNPSNPVLEAGPPAGAMNFREKLKAWYQASRPPFYIATAAPLCLGFILAGQDTGQWLWGRFLLVNLGAFMVHLATNLGDDLFDHLQGADAGASIGGSRVVQEGKIPLSQLAWALLILYSSAFFIAASIIFTTGLHVLWPLVGFAWFSSFFYVAPPIRYGYHGLGELFVFLNMGFIMVGGTYMVQAVAWRWEMLAYSLPFGIMVANILYYQSLPDMATDEAVGKRTLAVRLGKRKAHLVFRWTWFAAYAGLVGLFVAGLAGWPVLGCLFTLPLLAKADARIRTTEDWVDLDRYGHLIRKMYLLNGLLLILSTAFR